MKKYQKTIIMSVVLLALIALITLVMIFDVDLVLFRNLSISGVQQKKLDVEELITKQTIEEVNNAQTRASLETSKNSFDVAKETYENIDESTISIVQEATKEENYFIEYLWIVLGNYATANNVAIDIHTPGSTVVQEKAEDKENNKEDTNQTTNNTQQTTTNVGSAIDNGIQIVIQGRYANVADFVFDVENDKSLKFKLDNIKMAYSGDNTIQATFDVLSLSVLQ